LYLEYADTNIQFCVLMPGAVVTNPEVEARIKAAGFFGKVSALKPENVARYTMRCIDKGKFAIMPGSMNRLIFAVSSLIPSGILLYITQKVFNKSH
jgi:short-subunit dehydrogenase